MDKPKIKPIKIPQFWAKNYYFTTVLGLILYILLKMFV